MANVGVVLMFKYEDIVQISSGEYEGHTGVICTHSPSFHAIVVIHNPRFHYAMNLSDCETWGADKKFAEHNICRFSREKLKKISNCIVCKSAKIRYEEPQHRVYDAKCWSCK